MVLCRPPRRRLSERRSCKSGFSVSRAPPRSALCSRHVSARQRRDLVPITIVRPYTILKELAFDWSWFTASVACDWSVLTKTILKRRWWCAVIKSVPFGSAHRCQWRFYVLRLFYHGLVGPFVFVLFFHTRTGGALPAVLLLPSSTCLTHSSLFRS